MEYSNSIPPKLSISLSTEKELSMKNKATDDLVEFLLAYFSDEVYDGAIAGLKDCFSRNEEFAKKTKDIFAPLLQKEWSSYEIFQAVFHEANILVRDEKDASEFVWKLYRELFD
jgi:hypothetical protein